MNQLNYPGAKWWKFDFHTHTPASFDFKDFKDKSVTPQQWLQHFIDQGIHCVAITDHNTGAWIDKLKAELKHLEQNKNKPPLYLFPGVEISVNGGVHVLAIFDPSKTKSDIDSLLGAVDYQGEKGNSNTETKESFVKVVKIIEEQGGIAIPAHVDRDKGLFQLKGPTLQQALNSPYIHAIELCDTAFTKPQLYKDQKLNWTEVCGSDLHDFQKQQRFTWIKMNEPTIEGLKLALIDGPSASVNRKMKDHPNQHSDHIIEEITIENAKYIGKPKALCLKFSPFLNTIIGGRGSGKSTLLEFMRLCLRREKDIPESLKPELKKYFEYEYSDDGLLCDNSKLSLIYRKGEKRYRLNWLTTAEGPSLEVEGEGEWKKETGDIPTSFPVSIYSQKQIFALAQKPDHLLKIIDQEPSIEYDEFYQKYKSLKNSYKQKKQKITEYNEKIEQKNKFSGQLNDVTRQIDEIKKSGHKDIMEKYHQRKTQLSVIKILEEGWENIRSDLQKTQENTTPPSVNLDILNQDKEILDDVRDINQQWQKINEQMAKLLETATSIINDWQQRKDKAPWMQRIKHDCEQYEQIHTQLKEKNIDPDKYPHLLNLQEYYQEEINSITEYNELLEQENKECQNIVKDIQKNREELTKSRKSFLKKILENHQLFKMDIKLFGQEWTEIEQELRKILQCAGDRFEKDFNFLKEEYKQSNEKTKAINRIKEYLNEIRKGKSESQDKRFATHIKGLSGESINDLMCWFPEDALNITLENQQKIQQGSPGQKTATLLAFILSYGTEPLLLDQPEDDLDNELIYNLIVKKIREIKSTRQVIVITHNANIVVNGDSEMVFPLEIHEGQSIVKNPSSIQDSNTREKICSVLEGGREAFKQRYKRIHLEKNHV